VKKCGDEPSCAPRQRAKARSTTLAARSARGLERGMMCDRGGGRHNDLAAHDDLVVTAFAATKSGQRSFSPRRARGIDLYSAPSRAGRNKLRSTFRRRAPPAAESGGESRAAPAHCFVTIAARGQESSSGLFLQRVRQPIAQVAGALSGLQCLELVWGRAARAGVDDVRRGAGGDQRHRR